MEEAYTSAAAAEVVAAPYRRAWIAHRNARDRAICRAAVTRRYGGFDLGVARCVSEETATDTIRALRRLLVSEIKLYNEQKVKKGARSATSTNFCAGPNRRATVRQRIAPPVAARYDYFIRVSEPLPRRVNNLGRRISVGASA